MVYKILVCEDNEKNMKLFKDILEHYGYEVYGALDGEAGLKLAREIRPDLILMDLQMPVLDGFETIKRLKGDPLLKDIKVIAVTSFATAGDRQRVMEIGADHYIAKPINTRKLPQEIALLLENK